jgi:hypothetical protein
MIIAVMAPTDGAAFRTEEKDPDVMRKRELKE